MGYQNIEIMVNGIDDNSELLRIVLDTDTKNEIDDQFAITYALLSKRELQVEAIHAAPFTKTGYPTPEIGMEASYQEILKVLDKMGLNDQIPVFKGSKAIFSNLNKPIDSDAARNLIRLAKRGMEEPLYVVSIGAATNVASAILLEPSIIDKIVVVWLGSQPTYWDNPREFNLQNDPLSVMVLFDSGVPLVHVPCKNVAEHLRTVSCEIDEFVGGRGVIGDYLAEIFHEWIRRKKMRSKPLWDLTPVAYVVNPEWVPTVRRVAPKINQDMTWAQPEADRHTCLVAYDVKCDSILMDFFEKLQKNYPLNK